jgi:forkhead protein FKH
VNAAPPPTNPEPEHLEDGEDEETSDDEQVNALSEVADKVIEVLQEPAKHVSVVAKEHGNESNSHAESSISAYAKIAGRNWTYYVRDPVIHIGRRSDPKHAQETEEPTHIDLGPSKHVSRLHATVYYDSSKEEWIVDAVGRNGVRVDENLILPGQKMSLRSGNVLKITDTEMIFVLPSAQAIVHEVFLNRLNQPSTSKEDLDADGLPLKLPAAANYKPPTHISPYAVPSVNGYSQTERPSSSSQRQTTPNPIMQAPYLAQNAAPAQSSTTPQRGPPMLLENNDSQIDYSDETMRDVKPPMSYATLIAQAILQGPNEKSSLNGIYEWIKSNFAYYRHLEAGWQNSIRHNLSLNQAFQRVGRDTHEPGKGGLWYIVEDRVEEFRKQGLKMTSRGGARQSSNPSSPVPKRSPKKKTPPRRSTQSAAGGPSSATGGAGENAGGAGASKGAVEHTPSRAPRNATSALADTQTLPQLSSDASPLPSRPSYLSQSAQTADSPPTLTSSAAIFNRDDGEFGSSSLLTPAPQRHEPRMTAPSTAKLPSKYLPQSSPAPFWKNIGTTPMPMTSPVKGGGGGDGDGEGDGEGAEHDRDREQTQLLQSSSPPPPSANGSPTRVRPKVEISGLSVAGSRTLRPSTPPPPPSTKEDDDPEEAEEEDEGELDLMG